MCRLLGEPAFERGDETLASARLERRTGAAVQEVLRLDLAVVDCLQHRRIRDDRAERLHQVEGERRAAVAGSVVEAAVDVEADGAECHGEGPCQHGVGEGEERVDRIGRRAPVAPVEPECRQGSRAVGVASGGRGRRRGTVLFRDPRIEFGGVVIGGRVRRRGGMAVTTGLLRGGGVVSGGRVRRCGCRYGCRRRRRTRVPGCRRWPRRHGRSRRRPEQTGEGAEVDGGRFAFESEQGVGVAGVAGPLGEPPQRLEHQIALVLVSTPVAPYHRTGVAYLGGDQRARDGERDGGREAGPVLCLAQLHVLVAEPHGVAEKPAAVAVPGDGDLAAHQLVQARRRHPGVAHQHDLRDVDEARDRGGAVFFGEGDSLALLGEAHVVGLDVERERLVTPHGDRAWRASFAVEVVDLVGQADADERAARAFGAVAERRGNAAPGGDQTQAADRSPGRLPQLFVEDDAHPLAAFGEVQHALGAAIAVLLQQQPLDAKLYALGLVRADGDVWPLAALVVDGYDALAVALDHIDPGDQAEPARRQGDGAGARPIRFPKDVGRRQRPIFAIDPSMGMGAGDGIGALRPLALYPFEVGQTRAVDVLVHHPRRQKGGVLRQGRRFQRQFALLGGVRHRLLQHRHLIGAVAESYCDVGRR